MNNAGSSDFNDIKNRIENKLDLDTSSFGVTLGVKKELS